MSNFWDYSVWGSFNLFGILFCALLSANCLKRRIKFLKYSLIPTSVLAGGILLIISGVYGVITDKNIFNTTFFGGNGTSNLELITYHTLALGFIATSFKTSDKKLTKQRGVEIFNTGVTTVSTYLIQAIAGLIISIVSALIIKDFFSAAGILLPFGYGQGTGQALNYGNIFETDYGFVGGRSFGLTVAALGFLSAAIGGVIHLNILKKKKKIEIVHIKEGKIQSEEIQSENEIPMEDSIDKMTVQVAFIALAYLVAYLIMLGLGTLLPGMKSVIYGFNFLLGVLSATLIKFILKILKKKSVVKREYTNNFLMTRAANFFFDIMVVAGIAAIDLTMLEKYWGIIIIMGIVGAFITYYYNYFIARTLFADYAEEQFLMMYGMLTGTASTGIILLRELDAKFETPAADNMVYQNFPAILFGSPMMLLATFAPLKPVFTLIIVILFFIVMNIILFRSKIFKTKKK